jgi:hypothetical protein
MDFDNALARLAEGIASDLDVYRESQCTKYYAEKGQENMGNYNVYEKYKNRVRIVDCVLPHLERFLYDMGVINVTPESLQKHRTIIE